MSTKCLIALILPAVLAAGPATAQQPGTPISGEPRIVLERNGISGTQLNRFVDAHLAIEEVRKQYFFHLRARKQMGLDADEVRKRMYSDMETVIKKAAISEEAYKRIAAAARKDLALRTLIFHRMQERISTAEGQAAFAE